MVKMGFNSFHLTKILTEIFKDMDFVHTITTLDKLHAKSKGCEVETFLESYFSKTDSVAHEEIRQEASCIVTLFPHCSLEEVVYRLNVLGNEENRVRIVLRQLVKGHFVRNNKRSLPIETDAAVNTKKACTDSELELYNKPTTSKDWSLNRPCTSKSAQFQDGDVCVDVFVPPGEEDYMQRCSDRLKKHLESPQYLDLVHCLESAFKGHGHDFLTICTANNINLYATPTEEEQKKIFTAMLGSGKERDTPSDVPDMLTENSVDLKLENDDEVPPAPVPKIRISVKDLVYSSKILLHKTEPDISVNRAVGPASVPKTEPDVPINRGASNGAIPKIIRIDQRVRPNCSSKMVHDVKFPTCFWPPKSPLVKPPRPTSPQPAPPRPTPPRPTPPQSAPPQKTPPQSPPKAQQEDVQVDAALKIINQNHDPIHPEEMLPNHVEKSLDNPCSHKLPGNYTREIDIKTLRPVRLPEFPENVHRSTFIPEADGKNFRPVRLPGLPENPHPSTFIPEADGKNFRPVRLPGLPEKAHPKPFIPEANGKNFRPVWLPELPEKPHPKTFIPEPVGKNFRPVRLPGFLEKAHRSTFIPEADGKNFRPIRLPGLPENAHPNNFIHEPDGKNFRPVRLPGFLEKAHRSTLISEADGKNVKRKRSPTMEDDFFKFHGVEWRDLITDSDTDSDTDEILIDEAIANLPIEPYHYKTASQLMEMFPDACPNYIKRLCVNTGNEPNVDQLVDTIISDPDYPKRAEKVKSPLMEMDTEEQFKMLKELFPDADPNYLHYRAELYADDKEKLQEFIDSTFEKHDYPTIKEHLRKQQLSAQARQYTQAFKIEEFLKVIPDPEKYFNDPERKSSLADSDENNTYEERQYALTILKNTYPMVHIRSINTSFSSNNYNVVKTANYLDAKCRVATGLMRSRRKPVEMNTVVIQNIPLLQEIAFIQNRKQIKVFLQDQQKKALEERLIAKKNNLFCTCGCCFDDEVMPNAVATCEAGCVFCKDCIQKSVEVFFGEGKLDYRCLSNCNSHFSLQTLQVVLTPKLFSKMVQKKQLEEIKAAGIEDLESCPFCDFATIPVPSDKIFHCMNPECMKESCRHCKEPSHVPLRCDEVEKDDDIKRRTYIENKMTEALLRKCHKCGLSFIKSDGCNKMTCSCGAMMCYVCGKAVHDYKHFNGQGGDRFDLCPLYSDTNKLHQESVLKGAELAKAEVGVNADPTKLKFDPTVDIEKHYNEQKQKNPTVLPPGVMLGPNVLQIHDGVEQIVYMQNGNPQHRRGHHHRHHHNRRAF